MQLSPEDCVSVCGFLGGPSPPLTPRPLKSWNGKKKHRKYEFREFPVRLLVCSAALSYVAAALHCDGHRPGGRQGPGCRVCRRQGWQGTRRSRSNRKSRAPGTLPGGPRRHVAPGNTNAPSIAEKLTSCPGAARVKSNFQTQVDDCPTDPKPLQGQCRQTSLLSPGHGFPSRAPSCAPSLGCSGRDGSLVTQEIALLGTFFKNDMFSRKHFRGKVLP